MQNIGKWVTLVNIPQEFIVSFYVRKFSNSQSANRMNIQIFWDIVTTQYDKTSQQT